MNIQSPPRELKSISLKELKYTGPTAKNRT